jgi:hypothetical protein
MFVFADEAVQAAAQAGRFEALQALRARCEALPEFRATYSRFFPPNS